MTVKVKILSKCSYCDGQAYLPAGEAFDARGEKYMRYLPCPRCQGAGLSGRWINLTELQELLKCPHEHVTRNGGHHFTAGEVWDDIEEVCSDCGEVLD